ncbi:MAG TPA: hypothetical protein VF327_03420 [Gaiellaceae bacterium]
MSVLRAKCPDCRTLTAVAIGPEYQCHSCGREFDAGLVRLAGGLDLPWPDVGGDLPPRPLVSGGTRAEHEAVAGGLGGAPIVWVELGAAGGPFPVGAYVVVDGPPPDLAALEALLATIPSPRGAGFIGFDDAGAVTRLAHALGL